MCGLWSNYYHQSNEHTIASHSYNCCLCAENEQFWKKKGQLSVMGQSVETEIGYHIF